MLFMPIVNVKLLEGRSDEQLKDLVTEVTLKLQKKLLQQVKKPHMWLLKKCKRITTLWVALESLTNKLIKTPEKRNCHFTKPSISGVNYIYQLSRFLIILILIFKEFLYCFFIFISIYLKRTSVVIGINVLIAIFNRYS